jgi:tetratricopeptide (TPR) repeat protein
MAKLPYSGMPLGKLLAAQNRVQPGANAKKHDAQNSILISAQLQQGIALQKKGSFGLAAEIYQGILAKHPNHPDALHLMGTTAMAVRQVEAAIEYFKRAAARKPADPSIHVNLAHALLETGDAPTAEFHLRKALKLEPNLPPALCLLANCRSALGDNEQAKRIYQDILARIPDHPQALIGYADLCQTLGEMEAARTTYRKAIEVAPALALAGLAACEQLAKDSPEAAAILQYLREPRLRPNEYRHLSYAAAGIAAAAGEHDEAFAHFSQAKVLGASSFDIEAHRRELDTFKAVFTRAFFREHARHGNQNSRPVFVVGMPRSGTTLVEQIISRHPEAAAAGELRDIGRLASSLGLSRGDDGKDYAKRLAKLAPSASKELAGRYLATLDLVSADARRVTDKMPHNFLHLGLIALLLPNSRIIHCRRNPLDTCVSCFTTHLRDHNHGYAGDLRTLGLYYREYAGLMAHWREVLPRPVYEFQYERLIDAPEEESRKLIEFLELPWDPACLSPDESARPVRTLSRMQVRQPIYSSSVGRWRRYEKHLGPLKAALGDLIQG